MSFWGNACIGLSLNYQSYSIVVALWAEFLMNCIGVPVYSLLSFSLKSSAETVGIE